MNLNLTLISGEEMRAASAFITLLADLRDGETKDGKILSAIMSKGLDHVKDDAPVTMAAPVEEAEQAIAQAQTEAAEPEAVRQVMRDAVKRTRRTKAEMEADAAKNVSAAATEAATPSQTEQSSSAAAAASASTSAPTIDDVRAALQRYTAVHGMQDGIVLLKNYGAGRISELTEEQYPLFIAECDAKDE